MRPHGVEGAGEGGKGEGEEGGRRRRRRRRPQWLTHLEEETYNEKYDEGSNSGTWKKGGKENDKKENIIP